MGHPHQDRPVLLRVWNRREDSPCCVSFLLFLIVNSRAGARPSRLWFDREDVGVWYGSGKSEFSLLFRIIALFRENHGPFHSRFRLQRVFSGSSRMEGNHGVVGEICCEMDHGFP